MDKWNCYLESQQEEWSWETLGAASRVRSMQASNCFLSLWVHSPVCWSPQTSTSQDILHCASTWKKVHIYLLHNNNNNNKSNQFCNDCKQNWLTTSKPSCTSASKGPACELAPTHTFPQLCTLSSSAPSC
jgi:hypothetical protein